MKKEIERRISEKKKKDLSELEELIRNNRTVMLVSIKGLPLSNLQEISKNLREKVVIKVPKKNVMVLALRKLNNDIAKNFEEKIQEGYAFLFSNDDAFELSSYLLDIKVPTKAKAGQEAPNDIEIPAGPTDLTPGPAISELGALGIPIQIEKGKIVIKESKVIVKKGEKISAAAVDIMSKLGIKPFSVGLIPEAAYDSKEKKFYSNIKFDKKQLLNDLKKAFEDSLKFAISIAYPSKETISFLISKAAIEAKTIEKFINPNN
jgi:large subunit ribosomal protein L10